MIIVSATGVVTPIRPARNKLDMRIKLHRLQNLPDRLAQTMIKARREVWSWYLRSSWNKADFGFHTRGLTHVRHL
ncbi:MAG: hypothetical protein HQL65_15350 [Magnetococcales bacterium]|nr:hypothetical protein [Magnetococcales bacterium]